MVAHGSLLGNIVSGAVAPVQWAMAKGHNIGKTVSYQMTAEAARLEIEDNEAQRLTIEEMNGASAPRVQINNQDRLVTCPHHRRRTSHQGQLHHGGHEHGRGKQQGRSIEALSC